MMQFASKEEKKLSLITYLLLIGNTFQHESQCLSNSHAHLGKASNINNEIKNENVYDNIEMVEWVDQKKVLLECSLFITHSSMNFELFTALLQ